MIRPIDTDFLEAQTFGDKALQRDLLDLFVRQAMVIAARLTANSETPRSLDIASDLHTLKGSASAIGAAALAAEVATVERFRLDQRSRTDAPALMHLRDSIAEVCAFAARLIDTG